MKEEYEELLEGVEEVELMEELTEEEEKGLEGGGSQTALLRHTNSVSFYPPAYPGKPCNIVLENNYRNEMDSIYS